MLRIREVLVVEGKYDKIRLESVVDAMIVETDGFRIFRDPEQLALLKRLAAERGLLVLTDSDGAGFVIRNYLNGAIPASQIKHAYIPEIRGRERRKRADSREGLLGVEGMNREQLEAALRRAGATIEGAAMPNERAQAGITRDMLYEDGFIGRENSTARRQALLAALQLPRKLSTTRLLQVLNVTLTQQQYREAVCQIDAPERRGTGEASR